MNYFKKLYLNTSGDLELCMVAKCSKNYIGTSLDIFNYMFANYFKTFYQNTYKDFELKWINFSWVFGSSLQTDPAVHK